MPFFNGVLGFNHHLILKAKSEILIGFLKTGLAFDLKYTVSKEGKLERCQSALIHCQKKTHHIHAFSGLKVPTKYVKASEFYLLITQRHWIFPSLIPNVRNPSYLHA